MTNSGKFGMQQWLKLAVGMS